MAKILPAGANVNLNLGEDPFDRLLKTIQVASQVQGVMNQASLQRDRREAIKQESLQTMMLNSLTSMDKSNMSSVLGAEESLKKMRDNFVAENPELSDDVDAFYSTTLATTINPIKETHVKFDRDKRTIMSQVDKLDELILGIDPEGILQGPSDEIKEVYQSLSKSLSRYRINQSEYNSIMPDLNRDLSETYLSASYIMSKIPETLVGVFDETEKMLHSQLLNGNITEAMFDAELKRYYSQTSGRVQAHVMPTLGREITDLFKQYIPLDDLSSQIEGDSLISLTTNPEVVNQNKPTYYDDRNNVYFIDGLRYGNKEETLSIINENKGILEGKITNKDLAYARYSEESTGFRESYASKLSSEGKWPWEGKSVFVDDGSGDESTNVVDLETQKDEFMSKKFENLNRLGISVPKGELDKGDLDTLKAEFKEKTKNIDDAPFVKLQTITRANTEMNDIENYIKSKTPDNQSVLNENQLAIASPQFKQFKKKTENNIAMLKKDLKEKKRRVNQMTSFNKESLRIEKAKINSQIKNLEKRISEQENLLNNTDINKWFLNIATQSQKELISRETTNEALVKEYLAKKNLQ